MAWVAYDKAVIHNGVGCRWQVRVQVVKGGGGGMREGSSGGIERAVAVVCRGQWQYSGTRRGVHMTGCAHNGTCIQWGMHMMGCAHNRAGCRSSQMGTGRHWTAPYPRPISQYHCP